MCGSVIDGNSVKHQLNGYIPLATGEMGFWNGHAREETLDKWTSKGWIETSIPSIQSYTEGKPPILFNVKTGNSIKVIYNPKIMNKPFNIVTREAIGNEKKIHNRFPRLINKND